MELDCGRGTRVRTATDGERASEDEAQALAVTEEAERAADVEGAPDEETAALAVAVEAVEAIEAETERV